MDVPDITPELARIAEQLERRNDLLEQQAAQAAAARRRQIQEELKLETARRNLQPFRF